MTERLLIRDADLIDHDGRRRGWLLIESGAIVGSDDGAEPGADRVIDAAGAVTTPGFVDLHNHGGAGIAFDDDTDPAAALAFHRSHGTTRQLLSLVSAPVDALERSLSRIAALTRSDPLVLGAHLEGPFLADARRGAHDPASLRNPEPNAVSRLLSAGDGALRMVTLAPERTGSAEAQERLQQGGVAVAVGHTDAGYDDARAAFDRGASILTHAFNAMRQIEHRAPGPVIAAVDAGAVLELILDGIHVHPSVAGAAFRMAPGRLALVTDAMSATGRPDGAYTLGGLDVVVADGSARLAGTSTLAGSVLTQDVALRQAIQHAGVDPVDAVTALTATPACALGRPDLGSFRPGARADVLVLSDDWSPDVVIAEGRVLTSFP